MDISNEKSNSQIYKYISSSLISNLTGNMFSYGLGLMLLSQTGNAISFGLDLIITPLVGLLGIVPIGNLVDKHKHKNVLVTSLVIRIALLFVLLFTINLFSGMYKLIPVVPFLIATSFFTNLSTTTYNSSVNELVNKDKIKTLTSMTNSTTSIANIFSIIIGFSFYSLFGFNLFLLIEIIGYVIDLLIILNIKFYYENEQTSSSTNSRKGQIDLFKEGIQYISGKKLLINLIFIGVSLNFVFSSTNIGIPFLINKQFNSPNSLIAYEEISSGIGLLLGSFIFNVLPSNKHLKLKIFCPLLLIGSSIFTLGIVFNLLNKNIWLICCICLITFLIGTSLSIIEITSQVMVQTTIPTNFLGRVTSILITANSVILPIGTLCFTFWFNHLKNQGTLFIVIGIISIIYAVFVVPRLTNKK
jgi:MFS family permease